MEWLYHKTFLQLPASPDPKLRESIDAQINRFFNKHPDIHVINLSYNLPTNSSGIYISTIAFLTYSKEEE